VMLWDQGTWEPLVDDVDAALKKGDLKLQLNGVKLKGSWALIRTGGDGRSWLLIKHRDEWAGPLDIATFAPLSVKSGGDLTDIVASEAPALWQSNRAPKAGSPGLLKIVEKAVALKAERDAQTARPDAPAADAAVGPQSSAAKKRKPAPSPAQKASSTRAASTKRSRPRTRAASGRAARSPGARSRPR